MPRVVVVCQVLLLIDASFDYEMETLEFINICHVHGFPKIIGVLTHLDLFKDKKKLRKKKKALKDRFWKEVYQVNAKTFYRATLSYVSEEDVRNIYAYRAT